ncbi:MAG: carbamate kinase [Thermoplasmata archaeon]|nr:MAG: carbamate kinase [Thermoplasmata archaeon]
MAKTAVIGVGGNAILRAGEDGSVECQMKNISITAKYIVDLIESGFDIVLTHGNGPQVGNILLQNEIAKDKVLPMPLDVCVAESQGQIGYLLQQGIKNELLARGIEKDVVSIITRVIVDENDPAFKKPTKPIGGYYGEKEALKLIREKGWKMVKDDARGGYRRVVPSPTPRKIVEWHSVKILREKGMVVIAAGGGGIPVIERNGRYFGVEAVVDKDLATAVLAREIGEKLMIILTDVPKVSLNFGEENQIDLDLVSLEDIKRYNVEGHFPPGSMGPKIEAAIMFLESGGEKVIITEPERLKAALRGDDGTIITR